MRRYLRSFFCSLFIFLALCAGNLPAHAASVEEIVYADVAGYLGQNEEARWIADAILYASSVYGVDPFLGNTDKMKSPRFAQMCCIYRGDKPEA